MTDDTNSTVFYEGKGDYKGQVHLAVRIAERPPVPTIFGGVEPSAPDAEEAEKEQEESTAPVYVAAKELNWTWMVRLPLHWESWTCELKTSAPTQEIAREQMARQLDARLAASNHFELHQFREHKLERALIRLQPSQESADYAHADAKQLGDVREAQSALAARRVDFQPMLPLNLVDSDFYQRSAPGRSKTMATVSKIPRKGLLQLMFCDDLRYLDRVNAKRKAGNQLTKPHPVELIVVKEHSVHSLYAALKGLLKEIADGTVVREDMENKVTKLKAILQDPDMSVDVYNRDEFSVRSLVTHALFGSQARWYLLMIWFRFVSPAQVLFQCETRGDDTAKLAAAFAEQKITGIQINVQSEQTLAQYLENRWAGLSPEHDAAAFDSVMGRLEFHADILGHYAQLAGRKKKPQSAGPAGETKRQLSLESSEDSSTDEDKEMTALVPAKQGTKRGRDALASDEDEESRPYKLMRQMRNFVLNALSNYERVPPKQNNKGMTRMRHKTVLVASTNSEKDAVFKELQLTLPTLLGSHGVDVKIEHFDTDVSLTDGFSGSLDRPAAEMLALARLLHGTAADIHILPISSVHLDYCHYHLQDEKSRKSVEEKLLALVNWAERVSKAGVYDAKLDRINIEIRELALNSWTHVLLWRALLFGGDGFSSRFLLICTGAANGLEANQEAWARLHKAEALLRPSVRQRVQQAAFSAAHKTSVVLGAADLASHVWLASRNLYASDLGPRGALYWAIRAPLFDIPVGWRSAYYNFLSAADYVLDPTLVCYVYIPIAVGTAIAFAWVRSPWYDPTVDRRGYYEIFRQLPYLRINDDDDSGGVERINELLVERWVTNHNRAIAAIDEAIQAELQKNAKSKNTPTTNHVARIIADYFVEGKKKQKNKSAGAAGQMSLSSDDEDGDSDEDMPAAGGGEHKRQQGTKRKLDSSSGSGSGSGSTAPAKFKFKPLSTDPVDVMVAYILQRLDKVDDYFYADPKQAFLAKYDKAAQRRIATEALAELNPDEGTVKVNYGADDDVDTVVRFGVNRAIIEEKQAKRRLLNAIYALYPDVPSDNNTIRLQHVIADVASTFTGSTDKDLTAHPTALRRIGDECKRVLDVLLSGSKTREDVQLHLFMGEQTYTLEMSLDRAREFDGDYRVEAGEKRPVFTLAGSDAEESESSDESGRERKDGAGPARKRRKREERKKRKFKTPLEVTIAVWNANSEDKRAVFPGIKERFNTRYNIKLGVEYFPDRKYRQMFEVVRLQIGESKAEDDWPFRTVKISEQDVKSKTAVLELALYVIDPEKRRRLASQSAVNDGILPLSNEQRTYMAADNKAARTPGGIAQLWLQIVPLSDKDQALLSGAFNAAGAHERELRPVSLVVIKADTDQLHKFEEDALRDGKFDNRTPYDYDIAKRPARGGLYRDFLRTGHDDALFGSQDAFLECMRVLLLDGTVEPDRLIIWRYDRKRTDRKDLAADMLDKLGVNVVYSVKGLRKMLRAKWKKRGIAVQDAVGAIASARNAAAEAAGESPPLNGLSEDGNITDLIAQFAVMGKKKQKKPKSAGAAGQMSLSSDDEDENSDSDSDKDEDMSVVPFGSSAGAGSSSHEYKQQRGTKRKLDSGSGSGSAGSGSSAPAKFKFTPLPEDRVGATQALLMNKLQYQLGDEAMPAFFAQYGPAERLQMATAALAAIDAGEVHVEIYVGDSDYRRAGTVVIGTNAPEVARRQAAHTLLNAIFALYPDVPSDNNAIRLQYVVAAYAADFGAFHNKNLAADPVALRRLASECKRVLERLASGAALNETIKVGFVMGTKTFKREVALKELREADKTFRKITGEQPAVYALAPGDDDDESTDESDRDSDGERKDGPASKRRKRETRHFKHALEVTVAAWNMDDTDKKFTFPDIRKRFRTRYNIKMRVKYFPSRKYRQTYELVRLQIGETKAEDEWPFKTVQVSEEDAADAKTMAQLNLFEISTPARELLDGTRLLPIQRWDNVELKVPLTTEQLACLIADNKAASSPDGTPQLWMQRIPLTDKEQALLSGAFNAAGTHERGARPISLVVIKCDLNELQVLVRAYKGSPLSTALQRAPYTFDRAQQPPAIAEPEFDSIRRDHDAMLDARRAAPLQNIGELIATGKAEPDRFIIWRTDTAASDDQDKISDALKAMGVTVVYSAKALRKTLRAKWKKRGMEVHDAFGELDNARLAAAAARRATGAAAAASSGAGSGSGSGAAAEPAEVVLGGLEAGSDITDLIAQFAVMGKRRQARSQYEFVHKDDTDDEQTGKVAARRAPAGEDLSGTLVRGKHAVYHLRKLA